MTPSQEDTPAPQAPRTGTERRTFLRMAVLGGGLLGTGLILGPAVGTVLAPMWQRRGEPKWVEVGPLEDFAVGQVGQAIVRVPREDWAESLRARGVFVWRPDADETVVFSRACTDLGCPITWDPGSGWYYCPCHGAIFDRHGVPRKGPANKPLYRYAVRLQDGVLSIDLNSVPPLA